VAPGKIVVARVIEHKARAMRPLADVRDDIRKTLLERKALKMAQQAGQEALDALRRGDQVRANWNAPQRVSRENPGAMDVQTLTAIFKADVATRPAFEQDRKSTR